LKQVNGFFDINLLSVKKITAYSLIYPTIRTDASTTMKSID